MRLLLAEISGIQKGCLLEGRTTLNFSGDNIRCGNRDEYYGTGGKHGIEKLLQTRA